MNGSTQKFFIKINSSKIEIQPSDLNHHGYFMGGFQDPADAGKLYYRIIEGLVPVTNENDQVIISDTHFGKNVSETPYLG